MSRSTASPPNAALPSWEGPTLETFPLQPSQRVTFLESLGSGLHSMVFKVSVEGEIYALKVFKPLKPRDFWPHVDYNQDLVSTDQVINMMDSFHCECRAFGRLKEANHEDIAVRVHGYVLLDSDPYVQVLEEQGVEEAETWSEPADSIYAGKIRGIVKDFLPGATPLSRKQILNMMKNLRSLHRLGIVHNDIGIRNYIDGLLVDFSSAWTMPHFLLDHDPSFFDKDYGLYSAWAGDGADFDEIIDEWNAEHGGRDLIWVRMFPSPKYGMMTRSRVADKRIQYSINPAKFDWLALERRKKIKGFTTRKRRAAVRGVKGNVHPLSTIGSRRKIRGR